MKIIKSCEECLFKRQEHLALSIEDVAKRDEYLGRVRHILDNRADSDSSPYIVSLFRNLQVAYGIPLSIFPKAKYNEMLLNLEPDIEKSINASDDPLYTALLYSRIGNYIDFAAMNTVDDNILLKLINEANSTALDTSVYKQFVSDCEEGRHFLLLCDNCGEIVLDKLLVRQLKKRFPHLKFSVLVRGADVVNDATMEDAIQSGMSLEANVITNGSAIAGTVYDRLSGKARNAFDNADIILSKGQGNYESISGATRKKIYFLLLCKCELFTTRFNVPRLTGVFVAENP